MNNFKENIELGAANTTYFFISQFNSHETTACHHWKALACFTTSLLSLDCTIHCLPVFKSANLICLYRGTSGENPPRQACFAFTRGNSPFIKAICLGRGSFQVFKSACLMCLYRGKSEKKFLIKAVCLSLQEEFPGFQVGKPDLPLHGGIWQKIPRKGTLPLQLIFYNISSRQA